MRSSVGLFVALVTPITGEHGSIRQSIHLTAVQMRNAGCANSVFLPIVFAFALLGIARNHSRLCASTLSDMDS